MAMESIRELEKNNFSKNEIVALLYSIPLEKWYAFVRRFLKSGLQKKPIFDSSSNSRKAGGYNFDLIVFPTTIQ